MKDHFTDICNCPECSCFDVDKAHGCGLPEGADRGQVLAALREAGALKREQIELAG